MEEYKSVPVSEAQIIAEKYEKSVIISCAWDPKFGLLHTTTFGRDQQEKEWAAKGGEIVTKALGGLPLAGVRYEDFRPCVWCGRNFSEHRDTEQEGVKARCPCGLLKSGYHPKIN